MVKTAAWSIAPVWAVSVGAVLAVALSPFRGGWTLWIPVACGVCVVIALALQVATRTPEGFVLRASLAISGVVAIFAVASLTLWLLGVV